MGQHHDVEELLRVARELGLQVKTTRRSHHIVSGPGGAITYGGTPKSLCIKKERRKLERLAFGGIGDNPHEPEDRRKE